MLTVEYIQQLRTESEDRSRKLILYSAAVTNGEMVDLCNLALQGLAAEETTRCLNWVLKHGASVYYDYDTGGYYCSYHPRMGPKDTPIQALQFAMRMSERKQNGRG